MPFSTIYAELKNFLDKHPVLEITLITIGFIRLWRWLSSYVHVLFDTLLPRGPQLESYKPNKKDRANSRNWAVVTGCTAGIGEQFARQLAESQFNVILVSRSLSKLKVLSQEMNEKYKVETAVFSLDALTATKKEYTSLGEFVAKQGSVSVLINNLGVSHEMPTPFSEMTESEMQNIVQVNVNSTLEITRAVLPSLQRYTADSKKNGSRALVLTMGSFAGLTPTPLLSVYSGSKLFLQGWSSALAEELRPQGIDVQLVLSYLVTSAMSKIRRTSLMIPNPRAFVKATLKQIGRRGGSRERAYTMTPYWSHALMHWAIESTIGVYSEIVASINHKMHVSIRQRALRKKAKTQ